MGLVFAVTTLQLVVTVALAGVALVLLALTMSYILGWANHAFHVEVDPRVEAINNALPGANCGGCGYVGCGEYAEAVAAGKADINLCGPGGATVVKAIGDIMGLDVSEQWPYRAVVHCVATTKQRKKVGDYQGEATCAAANVIAGIQGCTYGCLGLGDCVRSCKYDAIHVVDGVARVDYARCTGCKACARVCPRNIISMVPFKTDRMLVVGCSNKDFGPDVKAVCEVGCIGCKACTRQSERISMHDNLPAIDYTDYEPGDEFQPALDKCPMASLVYVGQPPEHLARKVADEEVPDQIQADFKTSADNTQWRG